jgi:hypothetical protein
MMNKLICSIVFIMEEWHDLLLVINFINPPGSSRGKLLTNIQRQVILYLSASVVKVMMFWCFVVFVNWKKFRLCGSCGKYSKGKSGNWVESAGSFRGVAKFHT